MAAGPQPDLEISDRLDKSLTQSAEGETLLAQRELRIRQLEERLGAERIVVDTKEVKLKALLADLTDSETSLWTKFSKQPKFADHDVRIGKRHPIILTVANLKGGVGKTTITGNLIAYFDKRKKRVLAIDLDYQGSLTTMLRDYGDVDERSSSVNKFFELNASPKWLRQATRGLGSQLPRSRLASAFYEFARYEEYLMVEWLLQLGGDDLRYRLSGLLLHEDAGEEFDIVLIDVPPRLTTGTINALCASTHVIIPTVSTPLSAEPVANFVRMAKNLTSHLNPGLEFIGVLETMSPKENEGQDVRAAAKQTILEALQQTCPGMGILTCNVPRRVSIADAHLAGLNGNAEIRAIFNQVGKEIEQRVGL